MKKRHIKDGHIPFLAALWIVSACKRKPGQKKKMFFGKLSQAIKNACYWSYGDFPCKYEEPMKIRI